MRNRAAPDIMRRYASSAFSNGRVSIMGRTSVRTLKSRVSWVSIALPVRLPMTDRPPKISGTPLTGIGSPETPTTTSFPRTESPEIRLAIAAPLGAVARIAGSVFTSKEPDSYALADLPGRNTPANLLDAADCFMARHTRIHDAGQLSFNGTGV